MADIMVEKTQIWLNQTYGDDSRYNVIPQSEYGHTGWVTIYALTRALQIELGITNTADSFGPTTAALYGQNPLSRNDGVRNNKYAILQGSLWCKGYNPGHYASDNIGGLIDDQFDESVEEAVIELKTDAGIINPNGVVTTNFMKALLSMDQFKLLTLYNGDPAIRSFQQELNRHYEAYIGIKPCDGLYGRETNTALIYALQAEEGLPVSVANGSFGPTTKQCCPTIPYSGAETGYNGSAYTAIEISEFTRIFNFALYVNGYGDGNFPVTISTSAIQEFQGFCGIPVTGTANLQTWLSAMVSCGDNTRIGIACDTRFEITATRLSILQANNYQYIGRYLTGGSYKEIQSGELQRIFNGEIRVFPIFQSSGTSSSYFTALQGVKDAITAEAAARYHKVPRNTVIYFAVDFDALDHQVTSNILPYFTAVKYYLSGYKVGIYAPRNVCTRVHNEGYSESSFVSDMSTGYSGNLGYRLPVDWAFDQISNKTISQGTNTLEIDNNIYSGRNPGFMSLATSYYDQNESYVHGSPPLGFITNGQVRINRYNEPIAVYEEYVDNLSYQGGHTAGGAVIGYINPNDVYTRAEYLPGVDVSGVFSIVIHDDEFGIRQGFYDVYPPVTFPDLIWPLEQMSFNLFNSNGTDLVAYSGYFETKKTLDVVTPSGNFLDPLPAGSLLRDGGAGSGLSKPHFIEFSEKNVGDGWEPLIPPSLAGYGFVDLGLQFGASPSTRAIW
jgi:peptidoglycan hydrolase-like protein with peptidoglycan-binding domain